MVQTNTPHASGRSEGSVMISDQRELTWATGLLVLLLTGHHPTPPTQLSLFTIQAADVPGAAQVFPSL